MKKIRGALTVLRRGSSTNKNLAAAAAAASADGIVAEGYLYILHASKTVANSGKRSAWKKRYFSLHADGTLNYFKSGKNGVGKEPKGGALLNGDYFVGDSLLRIHGFQISDFATTVYLAGESEDQQLEWMFKLGTVLRMLNDGSVSSWDAKAVKSTVASLVADAMSKRVSHGDGGGAGTPRRTVTLRRTATLPRANSSFTRALSDKRETKEERWARARMAAERLERETAFLATTSAASASADEDAASAAAGASMIDAISASDILAAVERASGGAADDEDAPPAGSDAARDDDAPAAEAPHTSSAVAAASAAAAAEAGSAATTCAEEDQQAAALLDEALAVTKVQALVRGRSARARVHTASAATLVQAHARGHRIAEVEAAARNDPFSKTFDGGIKLRKGDAGYGVAAAGSQTAARAQKAQEWVESEIEKLLGVIRQHGDAGSDGLTGIAFGELFDVYAHISDTLVGILMRARKRGRLAFESDMLFQGVHDDVRIRILV